MHITIPGFRPIAALLGAVMACSVAVQAAEPGRSEDALVLVRLSACVTDPGATAVFLPGAAGDGFRERIRCPDSARRLGRHASG
ncbi:MAG: hypothetical protein ACKPE6_11455, partial [Gammaproteobacteria bacterium]